MKKSVVEPVTGIEPALPAWKAGALPLSYADVDAQQHQRADTTRSSRLSGPPVKQKKEDHMPGLPVPGCGSGRNRTDASCDLCAGGCHTPLIHILFHNIPGVGRDHRSYTPAWNSCSAGTAPQLSFYPSAGLFRSRCRWPFRLA